MCSVPIAARVGRQDFNYGDGSLVSLRDLNIRRPFDGIKLSPILKRLQERRLPVQQKPDAKRSAL